MDVLIIEDEERAADRLASMLVDLKKDVQIVGKLQSVLESINWLNEKKSPDLILMDIQLDDGICFEIFDAVDVQTPVIFTTAYDQYAIQAFQVNSIDYLLKPVEKDLLLRAFEKYESLFKNGSRSRLPESFLEKMARPYKTRFFVRIGNHFHSVPIESIDCFYIHERATFMKTNTGKNFDLDYSLDQVQKLVDPDLFFRINRNSIINIHAIQDIFSYSSSRLGVKIKMLDHLDLIVSREKVSDFKHWLDR